MALAAPIIAGITAAAAAAGTGYQIKSGMDASDAADATAKKQADQANQALQDQQIQQKKTDQASADATNQALQQAQNASKTALSAGAYGRSGTILTGGLGVPNAASAPGKTLLGQ